MDSEEHYNFIEGAVLLVNKPLEWTSFDVVNKIRYALRKALGLKKIKVGHAGTLDPLATGLLIICTGKATKTIDSYQAKEKTYTGTLRLGATTPSYDAETKIDETFPIDNLSPSQIETALPKFIGKIEQLPPVFSAIKVDGQPLYKKARQGKEVKIKARQIEIFDLKATRIDIPEVDFEVRCSKGTYIRSLAHDIGKEVQNGAYLTKLCRTKIGEHALSDAWQLEELIQHIHDNYTLDPKE